MSVRQHRDHSKGLKARCAIVTLSDTRTPDTDISGHKIRELLTTDGHGVAQYDLIPDNPDRLRALLNQLLDNPEIDAIITNGGTGVSPRDQTIPIIEATLDVTLPGFGELFRMQSFHEIGSAAMLSRATGGIARNKLLFALPGSPAAVELGMKKLLLPEISHLLGQLRK
jgi:molybdenum cofactor biosynthesis protein B